MTQPAPAPSYSQTVIAVTPQDLQLAATDLTTRIGKIVHSLTKVNKALGALHLGWAGDTADKAKSFSDQWSACMVELFGTEAHRDGVLNQLVQALGSAAANYDGAEQFVGNQLFGAFLSGVTSTDTSGATDPGALIPDKTDRETTSIAESFSVSS
ncbi:WXG100 family type VII secretion target [Kitasatospora sp. NPDC058965]|uniref:WXG100 family type VII secretion target n=1 Tax=Kitasatospora sp. NPDC058965 TaxID=3346682 RepID=UPI0036749DE2